MKIFGTLMFAGLAILASLQMASASDSGVMTYEQTVGYIEKQIGQHGVSFPIDPYQKGSRTYSFDNSQIAEITETSGRNGWVQKTVVALHLAYLSGYSVSGGRLTLSVKENSGGVTGTVEHKSVNGRESHEKWTRDRLDIEFDDYEVARRVGNAVKHLADLYASQNKARDNDPFK